jgi:hypothetical protein
LFSRLGAYRSLLHHPVLPDVPAAADALKQRRRDGLLASTFQGLTQLLGMPLCQHYQRRHQRSLL